MQRSETNWDNVRIVIEISEGSDGFEPESGIEGLVAQIHSTVKGLGYADETVIRYLGSLDE